MKYFLITFLFVLELNVYSQNLTDLQRAYTLQKTASLKWEHEQYLYLKDKSKADSILALYEKQIRVVKIPQNGFKKFIKSNLKNKKDSLNKIKIPYMYTDGSDGSLNLFKSITVADFYEVVMKVIFLENGIELPKDFRYIKKIKLDKYYIPHKYSVEEIKDAQKYLLSNVKFNRKQKQEIFKEINQERIIEMKNYLVDEGINAENLKFIEWIFNDAISNKTIPLMVWKISFDMSNGKKYVPHDQKSSN